MLGIPKELIDHALNVDPKTTPRKRRLHRFRPGLEKRRQTRARQTTHGRIHERGVPFKVVVQPRPG